MRGLVHPDPSPAPTTEAASGAELTTDRFPPEDRAPLPAALGGWLDHHAEQIHLAEVTVTTGADGEPRPAFEASEHTYIGDRMILYFGADDGGTEAGKVGLTIPHPTRPGLRQGLTYGQVVSLAGDFYGVPNRPISTDPDPRAAFQASFDSLAAASATPSRYWPNELHETQGILRIMKEEIDKVARAIERGESVERVFAELGDTLSSRWNYETGGTENLLIQGRYLQLAAVNWDHFAPHAAVAYRAGHGLAIERALAARRAADPRPLLEMAYAINAFADHSLSDLFSAGHLRTPRWQLYHDESQTAVPSWVLSLCSRYAHDEDCRHGLYVTSAHGDSWKVYGDKRYFSGVGAKNRAMVGAAMHLSVSEVAAAFLFGHEPAPEDYAALRLVPDHVRVADYEALAASKLNHSPLFIHVKGTKHKTLRRSGLADPADYRWEGYNGWTTLAQLMALPAPDPAPVPRRPPAPARAPGIDPRGWQSTRPLPPRWVPGAKVRYAVSFSNELFDSPPGPWSGWITLTDRFLPTLTAIPTHDRSAPGRIVHRQFHLPGEAEPRPPEIAGRLGFHEIQTTVFADRKL